MTTNHNLTFRTSEEMAALRPFGVICMIALTQAQKDWAAAHGIEISTDYEGLRFSRNGASVTARPRTDGDVNIELRFSEYRPEVDCYVVRSESYTDHTLSEALRALLALA